MALSDSAFSFLDKSEAALDGLQGWLDNTFENINIYGQEGVDAVCAWAGAWASYKVAQIEEKVVKALHGLFISSQVAMQIASPIYKLAQGDISADPGDLLKGILKLAFPWVPPTLDAIQTMVEIPIKLVSITSKIAMLASYSPPINTPGINLNSFNLRVKVPSMGDVMTGQFDVPDVPPPFTHYMKSCIASTRENIQKNKEEKIAQMSEEERNILAEKQRKAQERKAKAKERKIKIAKEKANSKQTLTDGNTFLS